MINKPLLAVATLILFLLVIVPAYFSARKNSEERLSVPAQTAEIREDITPTPTAGPLKDIAEKIPDEEIKIIEKHQQYREIPGKNIDFLS